MLGLAGLPFVVMFAFVLHAYSRDVAGAPTVPPSGPDAPLRSGAVDARVVIVIVDSLARRDALDAPMMPSLASLRATGLHGPLHSCAANFTLPCLLTAFEGRASPFLAALSNFQATARTQPSLLRALRARGDRVALISDHTLPELYPGTFVDGGSTEESGIPIDERDRWTFDQARGWLAARSHEVLVLHVVGTDKVSHVATFQDGEYQTVFREADAFVGELMRTLDLSRDTLVVFGDHGHGKNGDHDRDAYYLAAGPGLARGEVALDQTSLLFLLARVTGTALPEHYEGTLAWELLAAEDRAEAGWRETVARAWDLPESSRTALEAALGEKHARLSDRPLQSLIGLLPWLLAMLWLLALLWQVTLARIPPPAWLGVSVLAGLAACLLAVAWAPWLPWLALGALVWRLGPSLARPLAVGALLALAVATTGVLIPVIVRIFHVTDDSLGPLVLWFGVTLGTPALAGALIPPTAERGRTAAAALAALTVAALLPAPGVYYYAVLQSVSHVLPVGLLLVALTQPSLRRSPARWWLTAGVATALPLLAVQAGGWDFHYRVVLWLNSRGEAVSSVTAGLMAVLVAAVARRQGTTAMLLAGIATAAAAALLQGPFEFDACRVGALLCAVVPAACALPLLLGEGQAPPTRTQRLWAAIALAGLCAVGTWVATEGPYLRNMRVDFALRWLGKTFSNEHTLAIAAGTVIIAKYATLVLLFVIAATAALGARRAATTVAPLALALLGVKLLALALQMSAVAFVEEEKSSDLLLQEAMGIWFTGVVLWLGFAASAAGGRVLPHSPEQLT